MNALKNKQKAIAGLKFSIVAIIIVVLIVVNNIAIMYTPIITRYFGHSSSKVVETDPNEQSDTQYFKSLYASKDELKNESKKLGEELVAEGMVLLYNDQGLPLGQNQKISLFSESSVDIVYGGTGSGAIDTSTAPNLKQAFESVNYSINDKLWNFYTSNHDTYKRVVPKDREVVPMAIMECPVSEYSADVKESYASFNDAAIIVISRSGCEGNDINLINSIDTVNGSVGGGSILELTDDERDMIKMVQDDPAFDKIIVLLNSSNAMELGFIEEFDKIKACLWVGSVGQTGLYSVAKAFTGEVNPSGRLVDTYAYDVYSSPAMKNFGDFAYTNSDDIKALENDIFKGTKYVVYQEGIYIGYKYYETRYEDVVLGNANTGDYDYSKQVQFPFGFGLSYTTFEYSNYKLNAEGEKFIVSVDVTNKGDVAGKEVVQVYLQSPYTDYDKQNGIEKASVVLAGFDKTKLLNPNDKQTVTIEIDKKLLKTYDSQNAKSFILDEGDYYFAVGRNAHDALNNILAKKGKTTLDGMVYDGNDSLVDVWNNHNMSDEYVKSTATGYEVTNQFEKADLNSYGIELNYLTRSDWSGTYPTEQKITATEQMINDLKTQEFIEDKNAIMPTTGAKNNLKLINMRGAEYDDPAWEPLLDCLTVDEMYNLIRVGGFQTAAIDSISKPMTLDQDGPAGISAELIGGKSDCMAYPSEVLIASTYNLELANDMGELVGEDGLHWGISGWYAPSMNMHRTPFGGRNFEYYSEDSVLAGKMAVATVKGASSKGMYTYIKHFALNDQDTGRQGLSTFSNEQALREVYLLPFELAVTEGNATAVMSAYNRVGTFWAGGHSGLCTEVLRNEWGFNGIVISDWAAQSYMKLHQGLQSGNDLWLNTDVDNEKYQFDGYETNATFVGLLRESSKRILYTTVNSSAMNGISQTSKTVSIMPLWQYWLIAVDVIIGFLCIVIVYFSFKKLLKQKNKK